jgi:hypothetical protein
MSYVCKCFGMLGRAFFSDYAESDGFKRTLAGELVIDNF